MNTNDIHIELPLSKSLSNRWLILSALRGNMPLSSLSDADDTRLLMKLTAQMRTGSSAIFDCCNAGTVARFLLAVLSFREGSFIITGDSRLCERPIIELVNALEKLRGPRFRYLREMGYLPIEVTGCPTPELKTTTIDASRSSQFASALMMAGTQLPDGLILRIKGKIDALPYLEMTRKCIEACGGPIEVSNNYTTVRVHPFAKQKPRWTTVIERDWSAAGYFYLLAALMPGRRFRLVGMSTESFQGDKATTDIFAQLGVGTTLVRSPYRKTMRSLRIEKVAEPVKKISLDFTNIPDLFPVVVVACAALGVQGHFRGTANLRYKECDRIQAMQDELQQFGVQLDVVSDNTLRLQKATLNAPTRPVRTHGDHRMAMAFAPLRVLFPQLTFDHPEVVTKSFPDFWNQLTVALALEKQ